MPPREGVASVGPSADDTPSSLRYLRPYRAQLVWGVVMMLLTNLCFLGVPEMIKRAIDALPEGDPDHVLVLCAGLVGFAVATALTRIWSRV